MSKEHSQPHKHPNQVPAWKRLHRDWRVWLGVILMLMAMAAYVISQDESIRPGGRVPQAPAAPSAR